MDDILVEAKNLEMISNLRKRLIGEFEMKDLGPKTRILGMEIIKNTKKGVLKLSRERYLKQVLRTFNIDDCKVLVSLVNT